MFFKQEKLNPNNNSYLFKAIVLKLYYVIYSSTTFFIDNLICLVKIPTPDFKYIYIYFVVGPLLLPKENYPCNVLVLCSYQKKITHEIYWSSAPTQRKLPMQCTISVEVYAKEAWKPSLQIIVFTCGSVAYSSYHSSSFFK